MKKMLLTFLMIPFFVSCTSDSSFSRKPIWNEVTVEEFRYEVEEESNRQASWHYSGSNESYHYFFRAPGRIFFGKSSYFKVPKDDAIGISEAEEVPFNGKVASRSLAFSRLDDDRIGFTHKLSRGLVDNVLSPTTERGGVGGQSESDEGTE